MECGVNRMMTRTRSLETGPQFMCSGQCFRKFTGSMDTEDNSPEIPYPVSFMSLLL